MRPATAGRAGEPAAGFPAAGPPAAGSGRGAGGVAVLPPGLRVEFDQDTKQLSDGSLFGGSPARVMRLTRAGSAALAELQAGPVRSAAAGLLGRRLTDAGLAHPVFADTVPEDTVPADTVPADTVPEDTRRAGTGSASTGSASTGSASTEPSDPSTSGHRGDAEGGTATVTVIIPVRDRAAMLERCLAATGTRYPVIVVDDGSAEPDVTAQIAGRYGATVRRRAANGGPAAARNTGLAGVDTDLIAFLDSDCVPPAGWVGTLARHFADPLVGAVAPRIVPITSLGSRPAGRRSAAARYATACGSLDLGPRPARVLPGSRVAYVPTAALVVRRSALDSLAAERPRFDPALRSGEDVDLIWRLHATGWRIRYEPSVQVPHDGPVSWAGFLERRFHYGTSAAPLARRHPANVAPLVLHPWPAVSAAAVIARRPAAAAAGLAGGWLDLTTALRRAGVPVDGTPKATLTAAWQTWLGIGRYSTQFAVPAVGFALANPGGKSASRRWGRRAAAAALLLGPALNAYAERKPDLDPVRFTLARIADDICYGAGVWAGCLRERTLLPVRPAVSWRLLRLSGHRSDGED